MEDQIIDRGGNCVIYKSSAWGPAVPYKAIVHDDGGQNHGFVDLTVDSERNSTVPEALGRPGLVDALKVLNGPNGKLMSLGCENGVFESDLPDGMPKIYIGSYIDLCFRNGDMNGGEQILTLARTIATARAKAPWTQFELGIERLPIFFGRKGLLGLNLRSCVYADEETTGWERFNEEMRALAAVFEQL